ncbi:MAG: HNH endonuclease signature motif containing protein [Acidimicrobiales bacterium]
MSTADVVRNRIEAAAVQLRGLADHVEAGGLSSGEVGELLSLVRSLERHCVGIASALAECAHAHHHAGVGAPVEEVLASGRQVSAGQARTEAARLAVLRSFPTVRSSLRNGLAFPANVDVLARLVADMTPSEVQKLAVDDVELAESSATLGAESFGRRVRRKRDNIRKDHGLDAARRSQRASEVHVGPRSDGDGYFLNARLDSIDGAAFLDGFHKSLRQVEKELGPGHGLSKNELTVRALVDPYVRGVNTAPTFENSKPKVVVNVITDGQTLSSGPHESTVSETNDGQNLAPAQLSRLCCDATLRRIETLADGSVNVSHSGRTATPAQRAALRALYPGCAITGAPWSRVEVHHVIYYEDCKETALANLVPISKRWHHLVHDHGWKLDMDLDRTIRLHRPDGTLHRTIPPPLVSTQCEPVAA